MQPYVAKQMVHPYPRIAYQRKSRMQQLRRLAARKRACKVIGSGLLCGFVMFAPAFAAALGWVKG